MGGLPLRTVFVLCVCAAGAGGAERGKSGSLGARAHTCIYICTNSRHLKRNRSGVLGSNNNNNRARAPAVALVQCFGLRAKIGFSKTNGIHVRARVT